MKGKVIVVMRERSYSYTHKVNDNSDECINFSIIVEWKNELMEEIQIHHRRLPSLINQ